MHGYKWPINCTCTRTAGEAGTQLDVATETGVGDWSEIIDGIRARRAAVVKHFSFALLEPHRGFLDLTECAHVPEFR